MADERRVNPRKAQGFQCPQCGSMLEWIFRQDQKGKVHRHQPQIRSKKRMGPDDIYVDKVVRTSQYEEKVVGKEWLHTVTFFCGRCGTCMSEGQAVKHHFTEDELPDDYYLSGPMSEEKLAKMAELRKNGASFAELAEWLRSENRQQRQAERELHQDSLWQ